MWVLKCVRFLGSNGATDTAGSKIFSRSSHALSNLTWRLEDSRLLREKVPDRGGGRVDGWMEGWMVGKREGGCERGREDDRKGRRGVERMQK